MTNYIKAKIDYAQQNIKCGDRDETIYTIISKCNKLEQKEYRTRHDWMRNVIHWELCKKFRFDHTTKWYIIQTRIRPENKTYNSQGIEIPTNDP